MDPTRRPFGRIPDRLPFVLLVLVCGAGAAAADRTALPIDLILFARAGAAILRGDLASVYDDSWMQAGPLELLGSWLLLPLGHQHDPGYQVSHQAVLWGAGIRFLLAALVAAALLAGIRRLRRDAGMPTATWPLLGTLALGLLLRLPWLSVTGGHLAQLGVTGCWVLAGVLAARGRPLLAAALLGTACGWETWAVLAAPVLLLDPRLGLRRPGLLLGAGATLVAAAVAVHLPFVLTGRFALFEHEWFLVRDTVAGMLLPKGSGFGWPLRAGQAAGTVLVGSAVALAVRGRPQTRRDGVWLVPLAAQLTRLLLDPLDLPYYWFPVLALGLLGVGLVPHRPAGEPGGWTGWPGRTRVYLTVALVTLPNLPALVPEQAPPSRFATLALAGSLLLVAVLTVRVRRDATCAAAPAVVAGPPVVAGPVAGQGVPAPRPEPDGVSAAPSAVRPG